MTSYICRSRRIGSKVFFAHTVNFHRTVYTREEEWIGMGWGCWIGRLESLNAAWRYECGGVCGRVKTNYKIRFFNGSKEGDASSTERARTHRKHLGRSGIVKDYLISVFCVCGECAFALLKYECAQTIWCLPSGARDDVAYIVSRFKWWCYGTAAVRRRTFFVKSTLQLGEWSLENAICIASDYIEYN